MVDMPPTGPVYEKRVHQMISKYELHFPQESIEANVSRLINQCWKLIPMRENNENWIKQLDTVVLEITGLGEIFLNQPAFLQLLSKLEGLKQVETNFDFYRKTVFEIIGLIQRLRHDLPK